MSDHAPPSASRDAERVRISCPGCGRNDWVRWPASSPVYDWHCFNCGKRFELKRKGGGH